MPNTIYSEIDFSASPQQIYEALTDARQFAELTGAAAEIGSGEDAAFSCFDGMITGRHVQLVPNQRIVQAWRVEKWQPGEYSIVRFKLQPRGESTRIIFDHLGFPTDFFDDLSAGWQTHYWDNLRKYLG